MSKCSSLAHPGPDSGYAPEPEVFAQVISCLSVIQVYIIIFFPFNCIVYFVDVPVFV